MPPKVKCTPEEEEEEGECSSLCGWCFAKRNCDATLLFFRDRSPIPQCARIRGILQVGFLLCLHMRGEAHFRNRMALNTLEISLEFWRFGIDCLKGCMQRIAPLLGWDSQLAVTEFRSSSAYRILYELISVHCYRNKCTFDMTNHRIWIIWNLKLRELT